MNERYKNMMKKGLAVIMAAAILCQGVSAEETPDNSLGTEAIEEALDLANISPEWTYSEENDAWTMEPVTAVANAELPDYQGVSVCVPGAYVIGVDTDGDGSIDDAMRGADYNDDGQFDSLRIKEDSDANGTIDMMTEIYDSDKDGVLDRADIHHDYDEDGRDDWTQICQYDPSNGTVTPLNDPPSYAEAISGTTYEELNQFEPGPDYPDGITGDPSSSMEQWEYQGNTGRCALYSQKFIVEEFTGKDIDISEFVSVAENNGWFSDDFGTTFLNTNKMLDYYGIENEMSFHNGIEDIENCLSEGGRVIVAIDANNEFDFIARLLKGTDFSKLS